MFFYEFLWNLLTMAVLLLAGRKLKNILFKGDIFLIYLIMYPVGRFFLEFIRLDPSNLGGINANQTLMAIIALASIITFIAKHTLLKEKLQVEKYPEASSTDSVVISS